MARTVNSTISSNEEKLPSTKERPSQIKKRSSHRNRRLTLEQAIKSEDANFMTDYNPFQSDESDGATEEPVQTKQNKSSSKNERRKTTNATPSQTSVLSNPVPPRSEHRVNKSRVSLPLLSLAQECSTRATSLTPLPNKSRTNLPLPLFANQENKDRTNPWISLAQECSTRATSLTPFPNNGRTNLPSPFLANQENKDRTKLPSSLLAKHEFTFTNPDTASSQFAKLSTLPKLFPVDSPARAKSTLRQIQSPINGQTPLQKTKMYPSMPTIFDDGLNQETLSSHSTKKKDVQAPPHIDDTTYLVDHDWVELKPPTQDDYSSQLKYVREDNIPNQAAPLIKITLEKKARPNSTQPEPTSSRASKDHPRPSSVKTKSHVPSLPESNVKSHGSLDTVNPQPSAYKSPDPESKSPPTPRAHTQRIKLSELTCTPTETKNNAPKKISPIIQNTDKKSFLSSIPEIVMSLIKLLVISFTIFGYFWYQKRAERIGYCDNELTSNSITREQLINNYLDFNHGNLEKEEQFSPQVLLQTIIGQTKKVINSLEFLNSCQTCPAYSICNQGKISKCQTGFEREEKQNWESFIEVLWAPDQSQCVPKGNELKKVLKLSNEIEFYLENERIQNLCIKNFRQLYILEEERNKLNNFDFNSLSLPINLLDLKENIPNFINLRKINNTDSDLQEEDTSSLTQDEELFKLAIKFLLKNKKIIKHNKSWFLATNPYNPSLQLILMNDIDLYCKLKMIFFKSIQKMKMMIE